ncbi:hypothetical protein CHUAL_012325 [Chamberlinius hualienensis]
MSSLLNSFKGLNKNGVKKRGGGDSRMRHRLEPYSGDSGFAQWHDAMRMVARLPGGIPYEFRKRLWLTMANKHIQQRKVDWEKVRRFCFNHQSDPDENELGAQIVKDLHRTGCSLFCGVEAEHNQALLKRVLLAYAHWNTTVGYCQGFNMLAALILEVVEWKEEDALKVMIYLIEGVLPESYFANNLRGLSVDMAVFRDLLRMRLPLLSKHLDYLQMEARDSTSGTIYEPPLTNVFTMQWFLTIFSNCLPKDSVLRVWDLMFLEGNEILLRTALAIWDGLASRIMTVESADEFYSIMGVLTRETLEFGIMDANHLVKVVCIMAPTPFPQLAELRAKYTYNITPFTSAAAAMGIAKKGFRLFYSDDEEDDDDQLAVAAWCFSTVFPPQLSPNSTKIDGIANRSPSPSSSSGNFSSLGFNSLHLMDQSSKSTSDSDRMLLDISSLKKQYAKLRERQKQAHVILKAATMKQQSGHAKSSSKPSSIVMNHLLLGKKPLVTRKGKSSVTSSGSQSSTSSLKPLAFKFKIPTISNQMANNRCAKFNTTRMDASKPSTDFGKYRRHSLPIISTGETLHWKDAKKSKGSPTKSNKFTTNRLATNGDDSNSSTSTELCDEDAGKLTDFGSDLENDEIEETVGTSRPKEINLSICRTDDQVHLSATNIPSVIVSPDVPENKWEDDAFDQQTTSNVDSLTQTCRLYHSETSSPVSKLEDTLTWRNDDYDADECLDDDDDDDDDDYSEENRQIWLAKLEMYRKTLGDFDEEESSSPFKHSVDKDTSQSSDHSQTSEEDEVTTPVTPVNNNSDATEFSLSLKYCYDDTKYSKTAEHCSSSITTTFSKVTVSQKNVANQSVPSTKTQKPSFNPFPVARKSSLMGNSEIGVKLGLYEPPQITSPSRNKYCSNISKLNDNQTSFE